MPPPIPVWNLCRVNAVLGQRNLIGFATKDVFGLCIPRGVCGEVAVILDGTTNCKGFSVRHATVLIIAAHARHRLKWIGVSGNGCSFRCIGYTFTWTTRPRWTTRFLDCMWCAFG